MRLLMQSNRFITISHFLQSDWIFITESDAQLKIHYASHSGLWTLLFCLVIKLSPSLCGNRYGQDVGSVTLCTLRSVDFEF